MYYSLWDPTYILVIIGVILSMLASARVKSTYAKYSRVGNHAGITGAQAATKILRDAGITDVSVQHVSGDLTDHYNPSTKVLNLSDTTYGSTSVAALGVAAHECGHAIQHQVGYAPLNIRSAIVPVANFGSMISWPLVIIGLMIRGEMSQFIITAGIIMFCCAVAFQIVTLPVEFNASNRAMKILEGSGMLDQGEAKKAREVLTAAALTYVAAAAGMILQLLRLILIAKGHDRD